MRTVLALDVTVLVTAAGLGNVPRPIELALTSPSEGATTNAR